MLLDQKFIDQLISPHPNQTVFTIQQCRILLTDIACCSLMRLDINSMDKLWDLMVMLLKWQLFHTRDDPQKLLDITFRHMDGVGKLLPEMRKTLLIDCAKRSLIEFWDVRSHEARYHLLTTIKQWLDVFHVKISILIRLGFQRADSTFETETQHLDGELYQSYVENIGENIYAKNNSLKAAEKAAKETGAGLTEISSTGSSAISHELNTLVNQLSIQPNHSSGEGDGDAIAYCKGNILLLDEVNCSMTPEVEADETDETEKSGNTTAEYVHVEKAPSTLQKYLDQFRLENETDPADESPGSKDDSTAFDATEELLKMLDRD